MGQETLEGKDPHGTQLLSVRAFVVLFACDLVFVEENIVII